jgi:hypothetical protein
MKRRIAVLVFLMGALAAGSLALRTGPIQAQASGFQSLNKIQKRLISSALLAIVGPTSGSSSAAVVNGAGDNNGPGVDGAANGTPAGYGSGGGGSGSLSNYFPAGSGQCSASKGDNVKVNVNCLNITDASLQGRGQANNETSIAENPFQPNQLVASNNDYVRGDGTCGTSYSTDGGRTWSNATTPNGFTSGASFGGFARQYWQGGGDTSVAWDTRGNAYLACQLFNRGNVASSNPDQSSTFAVFRSTGNGGASWNFPGRLVTQAFNNIGAPFEDKELLTVDNNVSSPFRDRVYVTWTEFTLDGSAYIYESHSSDYGQTFSPRVLVSSTSALCTVTFGAGTPNGNCNENQFSQPFVGKDGALYVTYDNYNNSVSGADNRNQILLAKSTDGGATFGSPVKVSDYYDLPDCDTYQGLGADPGRACVPEKGSSTVSVFRATNYSSGQVNPTNSNQVVVTVGSYINKDSKESNGCVPAGFAPSGNNDYTGVKTSGACNNKILVSVSNDGGLTFSGATVDPRTEALVTQAKAQNGTDQYWQWTAFTKNGTFAVDYYDRQYGKDETTGSSDFSLSTSENLASFDQQRVTSSSMPAPTQFYAAAPPFGHLQGGQFYGDYTGLTAVTDIHPIWSDTRNIDLFVCPGTATPGNPPKLCTATEPNGLQANDQEIYTATISGHGEGGPQH